MVASWLDTQTGPLAIPALPRTAYFHLRTGTPPLAFIGKSTSLCPSGIVTDDADLRLGDGPELRGTALALLMVLTGRTHALEDLHGPGATLLDP